MEILPYDLLLLLVFGTIALAMASCRSLLYSPLAYILVNNDPLNVMQTMVIPIWTVNALLKLCLFTLASHSRMWFNVCMRLWSWPVPTGCTAINMSPICYRPQNGCTEQWILWAPEAPEILS